MARKKIISDEVREQIIDRVNTFNQENVRSVEATGVTRLLQRIGMLPETAVSHPTGSYIPRFRSAFLYLDRMGYGGQPSEICRLKWTGDTENWDFAIYRNSRNKYDPDEFFPGDGEVDGTVEGAMRAGMKAYPV